MCLQILKKDLKRKKAMNVILLVFIILASMFISSGVNNITSVTTALDSYFEMAGAPDYFIASMDKASGADIVETLENASAVEEYRIEEVIYISQSNITRDGEPLNASSNSQMLQSDRDMALNYFLDDGSILESVPKGEVCSTSTGWTVCPYQSGWATLRSALPLTFTPTSWRKPTSETLIYWPRYF